MSVLSDPRVVRRRGGDVFVASQVLESQVVKCKSRYRSGNGWYANGGYGGTYVRFAIRMLLNVTDVACAMAFGRIA